MPRAWSCIALGDERQYGGNSGYDDELTSRYSFDSNVANHKQVSQGDLIVLRDNAQALGLAKVEGITSSPGTKLIRRCPVCQTTGLKERAKKQPRWRCSPSGHEFDTPSEAEEPVTKYVALFGSSFVQLKHPISVDQLRGIALRPSDQVSIEELGLAGLERLLAAQDDALEMVAAAGFLKSPGSNEADEELENDVALSVADEREQVVRAIKVRRGQASFRRGLFKRYGNRCMVTGCELEALLEAAHIAPYRNASHNELSNGLLLRADIHTIYDLYLMEIDAITLTVTFDESVCQAGYSAYHGKQLQVGAKRPSTACLQERAKRVSEFTRHNAGGRDALLVAKKSLLVGAHHPSPVSEVNDAS
jgi:putative restriction endonuclease